MRMYVLVLSTPLNLLVTLFIGLQKWVFTSLEGNYKLVSSRSWCKNFDNHSELQKNIHAFVGSFSLEWILSM